MAKYLTEKEIDDIIGICKIPDNFLPMSQDSYNEEMIASKIKKLKNPPELLMATINMAIVGFGNQRYGNYRVGDQIINISQLFNNFGIKSNNLKNALLKEDDITPQRLCRFYRHKIRRYIQDNSCQSYLWRKYSTRDKNFLHICFRGAEYLEDLKPDEAEYLLKTVNTMDSKLGTNISDRVIRVFEAKGMKIGKI
jgi:hypothetical protein